MTKPTNPTNPSQEVVLITQKFGALRIIANVYKFFGWLLIVVGILFAVLVLIGIVFDDTPPPQQIVDNPLLLVALVAIVLLITLILGVSLLALAQLIDAFLATEENTRTTMMLQEKTLQVQKQMLQVLARRD